MCPYARPRFVRFVRAVNAALTVSYQRSANTQKSYARGFRIVEEFARGHGTHPLQVKFMLADTFRLRLEQTPTWVRVKGGRRGELARTGKPYSDASRANALPATSSFSTYLDKVNDESLKNPFDAAQRPYIDPDYSPTPRLHRGRVDHPAGHRPRPPPGLDVPQADIRAAARALRLLPAHRLLLNARARNPGGGPYHPRHSHTAHRPPLGGTVGPIINIVVFVPYAALQCAAISRALGDRAGGR